jgi:hypothetical protein
MNVLSDFEIRVKRCFPDTDEQVQISMLDNLLREKEKIIEQQAAEIEKLSAKSAKTKGRGRPATKKTTATSLKELAHKLMTEAAGPESEENKSSVTAKRRTKTVKKAATKRRSVKKAAPKKAVKAVKKAKK